MPNGSGFFAAAASAGGRLLDAVSATGDTSAARHYVSLVQEVFGLLSKIHDEVLDTVIRALETTHIDDTRDLMRELDGNSLRDVLKVQQLCDELRQKGQDLRPIVDGVSDLSDDDRNVLHDVIRSFEGGEGDTASFYNAKLYDLQTAVGNETDLSVVHDLLQNAANELAIQKAQFDLVARRAQTKLTTLP